MGNKYLKNKVSPGFYEKFQKEWAEALEIWRGVKGDLSKIRIVIEEDEKDREIIYWTDSEQELLRTLKERGYSTMEISQVLGRSQSTVRKYLGRLRRSE